jgi:hypothetical protein
MTATCVVPGFFYGGNFDSSLEFKNGSLKGFTDEVIAKLPG